MTFRKIKLMLQSNDLLGLWFIYNDDLYYLHYPLLPASYLQFYYTIYSLAFKVYRLWSCFCKDLVSLENFLQSLHMLLFCFSFLFFSIVLLTVICAGRKSRSIEIISARYKCCSILFRYFVPPFFVRLSATLTFYVVLRFSATALIKKNKRKRIRDDREARKK